MKEYRIAAYFTEVYQPRSYKRRIYKSREAAEADLKAAKAYYFAEPYKKYTKAVRIECRTVSDWKGE